MDRLRSRQWFGGQGVLGMACRGSMKVQGHPHDHFDGRPVIGICNTWSQLNPCHGNFRELAARVATGIHEAGGVPLEFSVLSLGEGFMRPTTMMFRNLVAMEVEEAIRANPLDGVVLLAGCDKTTPALLMGAASCDLPTILVSGGPALNGNWRGQTSGAGVHLWKAVEMVKRDEITADELRELEAATGRSTGSCNSMGTASTMASIAEALGVTLPTNAAIPAVDSRRMTLAQIAGRRIVAMVREDLRLSRILTRAAFENAIRTSGAIGGSTNAVVHLLAIAGRAGVDLTLADWDRLGRDVPCLVNLMPSGKHLMEDFYYAGGLPAVLREIGALLHRDARTVNGRSLWENVADAPCWNRDVIHAFDRPFKPRGGIAVLRGNLAPDGAIIKPSAATPALMRHRGRAVVFEDIRDYERRIDDPALPVDATSVLVLRTCGPKGYPGFPEVGNFALPRKLLAQGVKDMVRISDARMSGTAYGTVVLHAAPEAAVGGPLALVQDGDEIALDVEARTLHVAVTDDELARRRARWQVRRPAAERGYLRMYLDHVMQADTGADFDYLRGASGAAVARGNH